MQLYSEKIEVECAGEPSKPISFVWHDHEFRIEKVLRIWQDWGFPPGSPRRKSWRLRRHRTCFKVRTEEGRVFEIYLDRKAPEPTWVLYREIEE
jgi:acetone carboxylase gamma subunit